MKTFEFFVNVIQKVEVPGENINQAEQTLRQYLEENSPNIPGIWEIITPKGDEN